MESMAQAAGQEGRSWDTMDGTNPPPCRIAKKGHRGGLFVSLLPQPMNAENIRKMRGNAGKCDYAEICGNMRGYAKNADNINPSAGPLGGYR